MKEGNMLACERVCATTHGSTCNIGESGVRGRALACYRWQDVRMSAHLTATAACASGPSAAAHSRNADMVISRPIITVGAGEGGEVRHTRFALRKKKQHWQCWTAAGTACALHAGRLHAAHLCCARCPINHGGQLLCISYACCAPHCSTHSRLGRV